MDDLAPWEIDLLSSPILPVAYFPSLGVDASDVMPGMRIHNGFEPYMVVTGVAPSGGDLTRITFTVADEWTGRVRTYSERWENDTRMPVVTPSVITN